MESMKSVWKDFFETYYEVFSLGTKTFLKKLKEEKNDDVATTHLLRNFVIMLEATVELTEIFINEMESKKWSLRWI